MSDTEPTRQGPLVPQLDDLIAAERDVLDRIGELPVDFEAFAAVSNIYRAASAIRRHMEVSVLNESGLSWTAFTVLWVLWIWGRMEARHLAAEANVTKGTLTGVIDTLARRGLVARARHDEDRRLVSIALTDEGVSLIEDVFPKFNQQEQYVAGMMTATQRKAVASGLRRIVRGLSPYQ